MDLVPASWLNILAKSSDAAILEISDQRFTLWVRRDGVSRRRAEGTLVNLRTALNSVTELPHLLLLRVPREQALCKKLSLPKAARRELKNLLGFEIGRETPFEQGEVYWNYLAGAQDKAREKFDLDLVIVPRQFADAAAVTAHDAGFTPSALEVDIEPDKSIMIWPATQRPVRQILSRRKLVPLAAVTCAMAAAFVVLSFAGQRWNLYMADETIAALRERGQEASLLRQAGNHRLDAINFLSRTHGSNGSALAILAAATRALPNNTYLTSLSVHDARATMSGFSDSAASLIGLLAKSPAFRDPAFDSPVTESEITNQEKFTISASLAPAGSL